MFLWLSGHEWWVVGVGAVVGNVPLLLAAVRAAVRRRDAPVPAVDDVERVATQGAYGLISTVLWWLATRALVATGLFFVGVLVGIGLAWALLGVSRWLRRRPADVPPVDPQPSVVLGTDVALPEMIAGPALSGVPETQAVSAKPADPEVRL